MIALTHLLPLSRLLPHRTAAAPSSHASRVEVCPPELWPSSATLWGQARRWARACAPWLPASARPANRLERVKAEFTQSLDDVASLDAVLLTDRIGRARSLRELWHLRSPLYSAVSLALDQTEAERRLAQLNRHFPTRAPRSGFAPLDG